MHGKLLISPYSKIFYNEWRLNPDRSDYNVVFDQKLEGEINVPILKDAIKRFITDYIVLNSHIEEKDSEVYWVQNEQINELEYFANSLAFKNIMACVAKPFDLEKWHRYENI